MEPYTLTACDDDFPKLPFQMNVTDGSNAMVTGLYISEEYLEKIKYIKLDETDILLATYPRSGTTLVRQLLLAMKEGPDKLLNDKTFNLDRKSPFLEFSSSGEKDCYDSKPYNGYNVALELVSHRVLKSHLPCWMLPKSIPSKKVIVTRDVKDVLISYYYYHYNTASSGEEICNVLDFDTFYKMFTSGRCLYGNWFAWHRSWLDGTNNNTFWLHYEDLVENFEEIINKLAKFIDVEMTSELLEGLKEVGNFKRMKQSLCPSGVKDFVRKGIVGDHKNYLSEEQIKFLDDKCKELVPELLR